MDAFTLALSQATTRSAAPKSTTPLGLLTCAVLRRYARRPANSRDIWRAVIRTSGLEHTTWESVRQTVCNLHKNNLLTSTDPKDPNGRRQPLAKSRITSAGRKRLAGMMKKEIAE